jgi:hypothetical protein
MPANAGHDGRLTSDRARELVQRRWAQDPQGLDEYITRLERRRGALTEAQRGRLAILAIAPRDGRDG